MRKREGAAKREKGSSSGACIRLGLARPLAVVVVFAHPGDAPGSPQLLPVSGMYLILSSLGLWGARVDAE